MVLVDDKDSLPTPLGGNLHGCSARLLLLPRGFAQTRGLELQWARTRKKIAESKTIGQTMVAGTGRRGGELGSLQGLKNCGLLNSKVGRVAWR